MHSDNAVYPDAQERTDKNDQPSSDNETSNSQSAFGIMTQEVGSIANQGAEKMNNMGATMGDIKNRASSTGHETWQYIQSFSGKPNQETRDEGLSLPTGRYISH